MREGDALVENAPPEEPLRSYSHSKKKTFEFLRPLSSFSLGQLFRGCGVLIARNPTSCIVATVILLTSILGMVRMELRDNLRDGYTPHTSRARQENNVYREFLNSQGDPVMTTVLMLARDGGSMHRPSHLMEAVQQWVYISRNLSVQLDDGGSLQFDDFCGHYCQANAAVPYFLQSLNDKMRNPHKIDLELNFPIASLRGFKLHLERNLFGVRTGNSSNITNIEHVKVISLMIMSEIKDLEEFENLGKWELKLFEHCREYTARNDSILEIQVIGAEIVDTEMNKDAQTMAPYFVVGVISMYVFVKASVLLSSRYYGYTGWRPIVVGFFCAIVPTLAICSSLGLMNILGYRTNSPLLIMPFLINGIGVNDAFLTLHAWLRQPAHLNKEERLGNVLYEVGPSITTTTLTNVVTFLIGFLQPTEEISIFCAGCALALFFAYIFTITLYCPILLWLLDQPNFPNYLNGERPYKKTRKFVRQALARYADFITNKYTFFALFIIASVYWGFGIVGTLKIEAKLDTAKILPLDTPIRRPNRIIEEIVWTEFYPVTVIVNNPLDLTDSVQMSTFDGLVGDFEGISECRGSEFTISWLRDYQEYFFGVGAEDFDYDADETNVASTSLDYSKLKQFLASPIYKHHMGNVHTDYNKTIPVQNFSLTFVYENSTSWDDRIRIMNKWRDVVDRYPSLNASVWNVNAMFVDQMQSLKPQAAQNVFWTLLCMTAVCVVFIQNPVSIITATLAIGSISLGVTGYLSLWDLDLDPVSLCAVLISIGMAVDFVAHTAYHYQLSYYEKKVHGEVRKIRLRSARDRVIYTLANIAWPMSQAGLSTLLCILPLVHKRNYLPLVFVKTITLVVGYGLVHGLLLLPSFLSQLPLSWFNFNCSNLVGFNDDDDDDSAELNIIGGDGAVKDGPVATEEPSNTTS